MTLGSNTTLEIPPALADEVVRAEALARLDRRWSVPVTTVVAGAGFGKSTLIAQARRLQSLAPDGHEIYHRCVAGDETAERLGAALVALLEPQRSVSRAPIDDLLEMIGARTPVPVCLILDDVHELPEDSSGCRLVGELLERLPDHAHLVLVGRRLPAFRLAHLQAADRVVQLDAGDLAFSEAEVSEVATRAGRSAESLGHLGGWPALVRLTLTAPVGAPRRYLWDEVLTGLAPDVRDVMPYLALVGEIDGEEIAALTGRPIDAERIVSGVPLVDLADGGVVRCHQLWLDVVRRGWDREHVSAARREVVTFLLQRGEVVRAGSVAVGGRDLDLVHRPVTTLVGSTIGAFPADTGARWLRALGCERGCDDPAAELLRVATMQARNPHDPEIRVVLDRLLERADLPWAVAIPALAIGGVEAHAIADRDWMGELVERARRFATEHDDVVARLVLAGISAAAAELDGAVMRALTDIESLGLGAALGDTVARFYVHLLVLAGRAEEAVPIADAIAAGEPRIGASRFPAFARWCAGDPSAVLDQPSDLGPEPGTNDRFRFAHFLRDAVICASLGRIEQLDIAMAELRHARYRSPKDLAQLVVAEAVADIAHGDEAAAVERFERHLEQFGPDDAASTVHLRRYPAVGYPLRPDDHRLWNVEHLGPSLRRQLGVGRLLVELRRSDAVPTRELPSADELVTSLPLAWSTELLARAHACERPEASSRFAELSAMTAGAAHDTLAEQIDAGRVPPDAADLLESVPRPNTALLRIDLIGGCRMFVDGEAVGAPQLRRGRVRQLLALLMVEGSVSRDRIMECLWPGRDRDTASRNLRVTLSYVRRAFDDALGVDSECVVDDGEALSLCAAGRIESDIGDLRRASADLAAARRCHDALGIEEALQRIVAIDARDPLPDLADVPDLRSHAEWCRAEVLDALLSLGERRLTQGRAAEAISLANAARTVSPWNERAGRLAIAAQLLCGETAHAAIEAERMETVLEDLGVEPDDRTRLLLSRARRG